MINWFKKLFGFSNKSENNIDDSDLLKCPECNNTQWIEGPSGGSFGNIECTKCKSRFNNLGPFGLDKITSK